LVLLTACDASQNQGSKSSSNSQRPTSEDYQLPSDITIDTIAERDQSGQIFLSGSTNLPDGVKLGVEIPDVRWKENFKDFQGRTRLATRVSQDMNMFVQGGTPPEFAPRDLGAADTRSFSFAVQSW